MSNSPIDIVTKKEIYPACCSHLFTEPKNCYCCQAGCLNCQECKIDITKEKKEKPHKLPLKIP